MNKIFGTVGTDYPSRGYADDVSTEPGGFYQPGLSASAQHEPSSGNSTWGNNFNGKQFVAHSCTYCERIEYVQFQSVPSFLRRSHACFRVSEQNKHDQDYTSLGPRWTRFIRRNAACSQGFFQLHDRRYESASRFYIAEVTFEFD